MLFGLEIANVVTAKRRLRYRRPNYSEYLSYGMRLFEFHQRTVGPKTVFVLPTKGDPKNLCPRTEYG